MSDFKAIEQQIAALRDEAYATPRFPVCARHKMLTAANTMTRLLAVARAHQLNVDMYNETGGCVAASELASNSRKALTELKEGGG